MIVEYNLYAGGFALIDAESVEEISVRRAIETNVIANVVHNIVNSISNDSERFLVRPTTS